MAVANSDLAIGDTVVEYIRMDGGEMPHKLMVIYDASMRRKKILVSR